MRRTTKRLWNSRKQLRGQREQTMSTMSTQHGPAVRVIRVMDSIPWVRCASGNVFLMNAPLSPVYFSFLMIGRGWGLAVVGPGGG